MAEPAPADVARYTSDRLAADDAETLRLLSAGLTAARRFCGWHVTGVREEDVVTMDGPGSALLVLPTLRLVELTAVVEDGVTLDVATALDVSPRGLVRKRSGTRWSDRFGSIKVTMKHGFDDADDFNAAVLSFVDRSSLAATGGRERVIGPIQYEPEAMAAGSAFSVVERSLLEQYRLESPA
ncbi:hypothetical protein ACQI4L_09090 [Mycolicibacterium litorale]|uniref:hypothetical protein n=1 Tax=Mycolicibacterium litorale TaxID=758802 RepID=UPI003CF2C49B